MGKRATAEAKGTPPKSTATTKGAAVEEPAVATRKPGRPKKNPVLDSDLTGATGVAGESPETLHDRVITAPRPGRRSSGAGRVAQESQPPGAPKSRRSSGAGRKDGDGGANPAPDHSAGEIIAHDLLRVSKLNAEVIAGMIEDLEVIKTHPKFMPILSADPLAITDDVDTTGSQDPFIATSLTNAIAGTGVYRCGDNFFRIDHTKSASRGVPLNSANIKKIEKFYFSSPCHSPLKFLIASKKGDKPSRNFGSLLSVTPIELRIAMVRAIARACSTNDIVAIKDWLKIVLSSPFEYQILESEDDIWKAARQMRENISENHDTMRLSPVQQMFEFVYFKNRKEAIEGALASKKVAEDYRADISFAESTDTISDYRAEQICAIDKKMLQDEKVCRVILAGEETFNVNTPFDSIQKMYAIQSKAKAPELILWSVRYIFDQWFGKTPAQRSEKISLRWLQGETPNMGGKGMVDLIVHKYHQRAHMLNEWSEQYPGWGAEVRAAMRSALEDHDSYRVKCGFPQDSKTIDLTWRAGWPPSAEDAFQLMEGIIYKETHDMPLKNAIKNRRTPADTLQISGLSEVITEIDEAYELERQKAAEKEKETGEVSLYQPSAATDGPEEAVSEVLGAADLAKNIGELKEKVSDTNKEVIDSFLVHGQTLRKTHITILVEDSSEVKTGQEIGKTKAGQARGDPSKCSYIYINYDIADSGETLSHPHTRVAPLRMEHVRKCINAMLIARGMTDLHPGDCYNISDGGNHGNINVVLNQFATEDGPLVKNKRVLYLMFKEGSITEKYKKHKTGPVQQEEYIIQVTRDPMVMNGRKSLHFEGTNRGTLVGPVASTSPGDNHTWRMTKEAKKDIYGKNNRIAVGGPGPAGSDDVAEAYKSEDGRVPVFWHTKPPCVKEEVPHRLDSPAIIDFTMADAVLAVHCVRMRKPYCGVAMTEAHARASEARIDHLLFLAMQDSEDILYQPALVEAMTQKKPNKQDRKKPKKKKGEKEEEGDDEEEDGEDEDEGDEEEEEPQGRKRRKKEEEGEVTRAALMKKLTALAKQGGSKSKKNKGSKRKKDEEEDDEDGDDDEDRRGKTDTRASLGKTTHAPKLASDLFNLEC